METALPPGVVSEIQAGTAKVKEHKAGRFRLDKIGTGEGAQAYGWGLYFAESRDVGEGYRDKLAQWTLLTSDGKIYDDRKELKNLNVRAVLNKNGSIDEAIARARSVIESIPGTQGAELALADIATLEKLKQSGGLTKTKGNLYTVELLPDEEDFLDWDRPLSQQSEKVQKAIRDYLPSSTSALKGRADLGEFEGQRIYTWISNSGDPAERSKALAKAGIPGIKYLDGNSRDNGKGTSNYVIFDENLVKIIEENGRRVDNAPFSLAPRSQQDTEYLAAVEAGDSGSDNLIQLLRDAPESNRRVVVDAWLGRNPKAAANMQRMVDAAAKAAGYDREAFKAMPEKDWRTDEPINVINSTNGPWAGFFTDTKGVADRFGRIMRQPVRRAFLKLTKPFEVDASGKAAGELQFDILDDSGTHAQKNNAEILAAINSGSYDSIILKNTVDEGTVIVPLDPSQIKSADPITYDDAGNVIPLSQRFNTQSDDIRFSLAPRSQQDADYLAAVEAGDMATAQRLVNDAALSNATKVTRHTEEKTDTPLDGTYRVDVDGILYRTVTQSDGMGLRVKGFWIAIKGMPYQGMRVLI